MLNPMCKDCIYCGSDECDGTHEQVWTGCVYRRTAGTIDSAMMANDRSFFETITKVKSEIRPELFSEIAFIKHLYDLGLMDLKTATDKVMEL